MSTRNATIIIDAKLAADYNAAPKTRQKKALSAMRQALRTEKERTAKIPRLSKRETQLFLRINRGLSEEQWRRMEELNEKVTFEAKRRNHCVECDVGIIAPPYPYDTSGFSRRWRGHGGWPTS